MTIYLYPCESEELEDVPPAKQWSLVHELTILESMSWNPAIKSNDKSRTIYAGEQWLVTSSGMETRDGRYFIDRSELIPSVVWDDKFANLAAKSWTNVKDFAQAFAIAIKVHNQLSPTDYDFLVSNLRIEAIV
jgi:hypothetical protein